MIAIGLLFARILCDMNPTPHLALQHDQLMPERGIVCLKSAFRPEERQPGSRREIPVRCADCYCYQIIRTRFLVLSLPKTLSN
jgi:hypothetical protein